jgi:hypothetical protein
MGVGSAPRSLSRAGIGRHRGCQLPDAILHGKRSCRPRSRAVQHLAAAGFRVRLFSPLGLVVAPPACGPGQDTPATAVPRLDRLAPGRPPLLAVRWPDARVSPLSSQVAFRSQASGVVFGIADVAEGFHGSCRDLVSFPDRRLSLSAFRRFWFGRSPSGNRQSRPFRACPQ